MLRSMDQSPVRLEEEVRINPRLSSHPERTSMAVAGAVACALILFGSPAIIGGPQVAGAASRGGADAGIALRGPVSALGASSGLQFGVNVATGTSRSASASSYHTGEGLQEPCAPFRTTQV